MKPPLERTRTSEWALRHSDMATATTGEGGAPVAVLDRPEEGLQVVAVVPGPGTGTRAHCKFPEGAG